MLVPRPLVGPVVVASSAHSTAHDRMQVHFAPNNPREKEEEVVLRPIRSILAITISELFFFYRIFMPVWFVKSLS
jgi:hypothetical protein